VAGEGVFKHGEVRRGGGRNTIAPGKAGGTHTRTSGNHRIRIQAVGERVGERRGESGMKWAHRGPVIHLEGGCATIPHSHRGDEV
jgi:hypothetical protein